MPALITPEGLAKVAESLDQQMTIDISARGSIRMLYGAAREQTGGPLTLAAAELLQRSVRHAGYVMIATGWADQPSNAPEKGESDGPPGALALARSIRMALKGLPIIVTDEYLVEPMKKVARGAGMHCVSPGQLPNSVDLSLGFEAVPTVAVVGMPIDAEDCKKTAKTLIETWKPCCCISIERGAMNGHGRIHGMGGVDFSESQAKMDYLFVEAAARGIATIGIGDGGNEIGMANIEDTIREKVPNGKKCKCPCGAGITPTVSKVDVLLTATISNWAGYAVSCLLGLATGNLAAMDDELVEDRVLTETANADFHDSLGACVRPSVDGCLAPVHLAVIRLMREIVFMGMKRYPVK